jgi:3'(2'), 5'-bisphosphate nucleotidase
MWTLDPIDGTKGFLRGGQYAVCLALLVDARVELGVIGCPNLPSAPSPSPSQDERGALFVAVRGHGAYQLPLHPIPTTPQLPPPPPPPPPPTATSALSMPHGARRLSMPHMAPHELSFLESVEKAHAALDTNALVATRLGVRAAPVRMDSQAKYAALVRGDGGGGVYLRLPVAGPGRDGGYQEKIWVRASLLCAKSVLSLTIVSFFSSLSLWVCVWI